MPQTVPEFNPEALVQRALAAMCELIPREAVLTLAQDLAHGIESGGRQTFLAYLKTLDVSTLPLDVLYTLCVTALRYFSKPETTLQVVGAAHPTPEAEIALDFAYLVTDECQKRDAIMRPWAPQPKE